MFLKGTTEKVAREESRGVMSWEQKAHDSVRMNVEASEMTG